MLIFLVFVYNLNSQTSSTNLILIKAGKLIDVRSGKVLESQGILIEGEKIKEVGPLEVISKTIPANTKIIDLSNFTVLPGLIDCHTHIVFQPENYLNDIFRKSPIDLAVTAHIYARKTLEAGFTTIRDLGAGEYVDVALRNAVNSGKIIGPRMQVATLAVGSTGGHGDLTGFSPYIHFNNFDGIADGVDEIKKLIRTEIKNGADVIKMIATAGVLSEEESVGAPQYSQEEMNAVVQEAAMWGKKVAAHAHGAEGIKRAIKSGVASIDHGSLIDDEGIQMMIKRGTYLVADVYNDDYILAEFSRMGYPQKIIEKERLIGRLQRENFKKAALAGVKIAYGTDAGVYPHGWNGKQFFHMVRWGLTPMQAIQSATINAADLLGWDDRVGTIESGKFADIVAVRNDPLVNISELENINFVMKGGSVIKNETNKK
ncbi:MAG: amidohydrolase family protein [Ignavibacteria bacterium]|nr:amidohydrolase family protein [Ignavibacteria bacterium]